MKFCPQCRSSLTVGDDSGRRRLVCSSKRCVYVHYDNPVPVVAGLVEHDGDILLARNAAWPSGMFSLITGFLEKDETPEDGIIREVSEELGLEVEATEFIGYYSFFDMNQLILAFHISTHGDLALSDEIAEIKRLAPEKLKSWDFGTGLAVRDWLAKRDG